MVRRAASYAERLLSDLESDPNPTGLDVYVASGRSRRWRPKSVYMEALLIRHTDKRTPTVLVHGEPLMHQLGHRRPWQLQQTAEGARDKMSAVLKRWQQSVC